MEEDGGSRHERPGPPRVVAAAAALALLVLLLLAAAATGPWSWPGVDGGPTIAPSGSGVLTPADASESLEDLEDADGGDTEENPVLRWFLILLAIGVFTLLLLLALRFLTALLRRPPPAVPPDHLVTLAAADTAVDAPAMREGIEAARGILDSDRPPRDAIVEAWLELERAASVAGVGRHPAQTPTEFTTAVLARTPADERAVEVLRDLYRRVRFSSEPVGPGDGDAARAALRTIARSWAEVGAQQ